MSECRWMNEIERWFDGEKPETAELKEHLASCPVCEAHLRELRALRDLTASAVKHEEIGDAQFPAFMAGIREGIESRPQRGFAPRWRAAWAVLSVAAAALIVSLSLLFLISDEPRQADATLVESVSTDLEGATVTSYDSEEGVTTVWVTMSQDDLW